MAGGASGAIGFWAHETRRQVRELERRAAALKVRRRPAATTRTRERLDLPCPWLCLECGYLEPPARAGDPMRTAAGDVAPTACRHCRAHAWADLADVSTAAFTREIEQHESLRGWWWIAALLGRRRRTPWRWRVPALAHHEAAVITRGHAQCDEILRAPLSGRPALAWRVEVRYADHPRAPIALVEQSCGALRIDTVIVTREPTIAVHMESVTLAGDADRYLRTRGLDPCDALRVREAIVEPDAMVTLCGDRRGGPPILR